VPEDVKTLVQPVFAHRLLLSPDAAMRGVTSAEVLNTVVESVTAPAPTRS
jgi:MoxR-like ATPase